MTEQERGVKRRAYFRAYAKANREKRKAYMAGWREANRERYNAMQLIANRRLRASKAGSTSVPAPDPEKVKRINYLKARLDAVRAKKEQP